MPCSFAKEAFKALKLSKSARYLAREWSSHTENTTDTIKRRKQNELVNIRHCCNY